MKVIKIVMACLLFFCFVSHASALPWDNPTVETWYYMNTTHTVNGDLGYQLNLTQGDTSVFVEQDWAGVRNITLAWNIILVSTDGSETALGTHVAMANRSTDGEGIQTATWTPDITTIIYGYDALKIQPVMTVNGTSVWDIEATFMSYILETKELQNYTWTFQTYTKYEYAGGTTRGWFYWGDLTYQSRIQGIQMVTLNPWEMQMERLREGDFYGFVVMPWTYWLGDMVYGVALLFVAVTTFNRYNDVRPVIVMFWIFGGTGGLLTLLIPFVSLHLAWFLLAFALACTLYVTIR